MASEILTVIQRVIDQHKVLRQNLESVDQVANDKEALGSISSASSSLQADEPEGVAKLQALFSRLDHGMRAHFDFEETELVAAFHSLGQPELDKALHDLLMAHRDIRDRLAQGQQDIENLSKAVREHRAWETSGYDMRTHLVYTHKMIEKHAQNEEIMLDGLKKKLEAGG